MAKKLRKQIYGSSDANTAANGNYSVTVDFSDGPRGTVTIAPRKDTHSWSNKSYVKPNTPLRKN